MSIDGPHASGQRPPKMFRGSHARLRRVTLRGNWSTEIWIFVALVLFLLFVALPWIATRSPPN